METFKSLFAKPDPQQQVRHSGTVDDAHWAIRLSRLLTIDTDAKM
jgi:hypothetical protein